MLAALTALNLHAGMEISDRRKEARLSLRLKKLEEYLR
jgi:hypothetical protein